MIHPRARPAADGPEENRTVRAPGPDLLSCVLQALPLGVALFELRGDEFLFSVGNREFWRLLRLDRPRQPGATLAEVFSGPDRQAVNELFEQVRDRAEPQGYFSPEGVRGSQQGTWNLDAYPVLTGGRLSHIMVLAENSDEKMDVRQRQQHETNRLREKADQLAELEKAKSEFLRLASHELRGPAAMLSGYLAMMEDETLGPVPERLRPVLPLLRSKAGQINMLANEMVEAARLEDRRLQLKRKRVDLREVARRSVNATREGLGPKHELHFVDRTTVPVPVLGDSMRLEIIINNLIDNAIKYSPEGGEITVELSMAGELALLAIRDAGIGIAAEDMDRLFIRFNRIAPRNDVPGTGLGLYLARELARLHGGDIAAVSKLGEGSEFTLSLPLEQKIR